MQQCQSEPVEDPFFKKAKQQPTTNNQQQITDNRKQITDNRKIQLNAAMSV